MKLRKLSEEECIVALQEQHGYMIARMPRAGDDYTTMFRRNRKTGKTTWQPARCYRLVAPEKSWLTKQIKPRPEKRSRKKVR